MTAAPQGDPKSRTVSTVLRAFVALVALVITASLLIATVRAYLVVRNGLALLALARNPSALLTAGSADKVPVNLAEIGRGLGGLHAQLGPLLRAGRVLGPGPRANLQTLDQLMGLGAELATAGAEAAKLLPALAHASRGATGADQANTEMTQALFAALASEREHLAAAAGMMDPLLLPASKLSTTGLEPRLAKAVTLVKKAVPLGPVALRAAVALPPLLGENGPVHYLLLAQNNDEIRATGGFVTGIGIVSLNRGRLERFAISDSYAYDKFTVDHPFAPDPMQKYMGIILWTTRDGNWSPDFPTSARDTLALFGLENTDKISGTIAFDMFALPPLVQAMGPIDLPELGEPVTAKNVLSVVRESWGPDIPEGMTLAQWREQVGPSGYKEWYAHRKDLLGLLGKAMLTRLQGGGGMSQLAPLFRGILQVFEQRHLMANVDEAAVQDLLAALHWDGSIQSPAGSDYLLAVDTNIGYNKVNYHVQRSLEYQVDLTATEPHATLVIHWNNPNPAVAECILKSKYTATYDGMTRGCYWNYLRVYAPAGSRLMASEGFTDTIEVKEELGKSLFGSFVVVAAAERRSVRLDYRLPGLVPGQYRILVQKQPGTAAEPLRVTVILPPGGILQSALPRPEAVDGRRIDFKLTLREDQVMEVQWR